MDSLAVKQLNFLKEQIRKLQAAPRGNLAVLSTGIHALDQWLPARGLPLGQVTELWGEAASGRTSLALRVLGMTARSHRLGAYVDGPGELYPPAAAALDVDLTRVLLVRPKAPGQLVWTAVQLARSGAFACVVLDLTHTGVLLSTTEGKKLAGAAAQGGTCLLLLTAKEAPGHGALRLEISADDLNSLRIAVQRSRQGNLNRHIVLPAGSLYPQEVPCFRYRSPALVFSPNQPRSEEIPPFKRLKLQWARDGGGIDGTRPGRDTALLPLQSSTVL